MSYQQFKPDRFICEPELASFASRFKAHPVEITDPATASGIADNATVPGRYYLSKTVVAFTGKPGLKVVKVGEDSQDPIADFVVSWIFGCPHRCVFCHSIYLCRNYPYIAVDPRIEEVERLISQTALNWHGDRPFICKIDDTTDLLAFEHLTGWTARLVRFFASEIAPHGQLFFTTRSANPAPLLKLDHRRATRAGISFTLAEHIRELEPGTAGLPARLDFLTKTAAEGYPVHISISPVIPSAGYERAYEKLFEQIAKALLMSGTLELLDLTVDVLMHYVKPECEPVIAELAPHVMDGMVTRRVDDRARFAYPQETHDQAVRYFRRMMPQYIPTARVLAIR